VQFPGTLTPVNDPVDAMDFGVHLPLIDFADALLDGTQLSAYARAAADLGYATLAANDHLIWQKAWLDGPAALSSVLRDAGSMTLATSITLPVVRHPVVVAKWLATLACLTDSRVVAGLGPGSSPADYRAVGMPFDERWARFDEAMPAVKALVRGEQPRTGPFYKLGDVRLEPLPTRAPEVWAGSWGSPARLRAMATVADGWIASGYNTTPARFRESRARMDEHLEAVGRDPSTFPDLIATMWLCVTKDRAEADRVVRGVLAPALRRDAEDLAERLPIGPPERCRSVLRAYATAGAQQVLLWPIRDPIRQLHLFAEEVRGEVDA
jgi:alkanesulfonate monooxygenase SsuD/methylene tetrahydromethanopterin reductase-like flavin-dependent oxidoreductase (luciferase family)